MSMRSEAPEEQKRFYGSPAWKRCRAEYRKSVGGLCERCKARGIIEAGYYVHHKEYVSRENITDPNILLSFDNLELLCKNCHSNEHAKNKKRFVVGPDGKIFC